MAIKYDCVLHHLVVKVDIPKLDKIVRKRVENAISVKLVNSPLVFGMPLRGTLRNYWKLRVGDYRIIYIIFAQKVGVVAIGHRSDIYEMVARRI